MCAGSGQRYAHAWHICRCQTYVCMPAPHCYSIQSMFGGLERRFIVDCETVSYSAACSSLLYTHLAPLTKGILCADRHQAMVSLALPV